MKRRITQTRSFERDVNTLIKKRKLLKKNFDDFKNDLCKNPEGGDLITGTGGVRKIRMKSASKGKNGGFRVCYFDDATKRRDFPLTALCQE